MDLKFSTKYYLIGSWSCNSISIEQEQGDNWSMYATMNLQILF